MSTAAEILPVLPKGWRVATYCGAPVALCPERLIHYAIDGEWILYVPWFRGKMSDIAILLDAQGRDVEAKIDAGNTITTPRGRKVGPRAWNH